MRKAVLTLVSVATLTAMAAMPAFAATGCYQRYNGSTAGCPRNAAQVSQACKVDASYLGQLCSKLGGSCANMQNLCNTILNQFCNK